MAWQAGFWPVGHLLHNPNLGRLSGVIAILSESDPHPLLRYWLTINLFI